MVTHQTDANISLLHAACSRPITVFKDVLQLIHSGFSSNKLTQDEVKALLLEPNLANYTPLHEVLNLGSTGNVIAYLKALQQYKAAFNSHDITTLFTQLAAERYSWMYALAKNKNIKLLKYVHRKIRLDQ